jgi:phospholipid-binding lipoprotein MlaA
MTGWVRSLRCAGGLLLALLLSACATGPNANPADPLEPFNRTMYQFNDGLDRAVLKPVATVYRDVTPSMIRRGIGNFFNNLEDVWSFVNNLLQLKGQAAGESLMRVNVNTLFGLGGIFDLATDLQIERHTEDFGQTLGHWGVGAGPYIVLPILGPSTLRDTVALPVDFKGDVVIQVDEVPTRNALVVLRAVNQRAELLKASTMLEEAALDRYTFLRDAYLQRRRNAVYDGNPPEEEMPQDLEPAQ